MLQEKRLLGREISRYVELAYLLSVPPGYEQGAAEQWPLLIFLHGSGERGSQLEAVANYGIPKLIEEGKELPFIVASPQCPVATTWSDHLDALATLVTDLLASHDADPSRVLLTGMSMGGTGTWHLASRLPQTFAAIAPVCGDRTWYVGDPSQICALRDVPVWAFHGENDETVSPAASEELVAALEACGGAPRLTLYEGVGHNCWNHAYANEELYSWLLQQRLA